METSTPIFEDEEFKKPIYLKVSQRPVNGPKNHITEAVDDTSRDD